MADAAPQQSCHRYEPAGNGCCHQGEALFDPARSRHPRPRTASNRPIPSPAASRRRPGSGPPDRPRQRSGLGQPNRRARCPQPDQTARNGSVSQLGIRRLHRSVMVAATTTIATGHNANPSISLDSQPAKIPGALQYAGPSAGPRPMRLLRQQHDPPAAGDSAGRTDACDHLVHSRHGGEIDESCRGRILNRVLTVGIAQGQNPKCRPSSWSSSQADLPKNVRRPQVR